MAMKPQEIVSATRHALTATVEAVTGFAKLERVLAVVCSCTPALLIWSDDGPIRNTISDYYNMKQNQLFYVPLTVASMLFVVNGVVKKKHFYNTLLGVMLAGVLLFNVHDFTALHAVFAIGFFGGNAVVIVWKSPRKELGFKLLLVALIALAIIGWLFLGWYSLFWAEWASLGIIAVHYILESLDLIH
jgi:hypothetical protein